MSPRARHALQVISIALALLLCGCGGSRSDQERIQKSLGSCADCVDFAKKQWNEHRVPDTYLTQLLKAASKGEKKHQEQIRNMARAGQHVEALEAQLRQFDSQLMEATGELARVKR